MCDFRQAPGSLSSLYRSSSSPWYVRGVISALAVQVKRLGHASRSTFGGTAVGSVSSFATRSDQTPTSTTGTNAAAGLRGATAASLTKLSRGFAEFGWIDTSCATLG